MYFTVRIKCLSPAQYACNECGYWTTLSQDRKVLIRVSVYGGRSHAPWEERLTFCASQQAIPKLRGLKHRWPPSTSHGCCGSGIWQELRWVVLAWGSLVRQQSGVAWDRTIRRLDRGWRRHDQGGVPCGRQGGTSWGPSAGPLECPHGLVVGLPQREQSSGST